MSNFLKILLACLLAFYPAAPSFAAIKLQPITIAQYGHIFLYMPLYVALDKGFFKEQGLDVKLVSTGGDEKTFAAVTSGNAQFGVSDPVFTAIARERGQGGKVVAGLVRGTPFWTVTFKPEIKKFDNAAGFSNYRVTTYPAPSTCYAVMKNILQNNGKPVNAKIVQGAFGTSLALLKANQADLAFEIEPTVSIAVNKGAHVVYSPTKQMGDFAFTGLMVSDSFFKQHPDQIQQAVNALNKAMLFMRKDFNGSFAVAKKQFPEVPEQALREALKRMLDSGTTPANTMLPKEAWNNATALRRQLGDLKGPGRYEDNVDMTFANKALH
ncbi:MAG: ABC transporter substrate-binding protein [Candidatus Obscuribacterales bacterium]|nr:ABC transporter substrate-binding protein [Candidatus Obscuribacterales bacterium]